MAKWVKWMFVGAGVTAGFGFGMEYHWMVSVSLILLLAGVVLGVYYRTKGKKI